MISTVTWRIVSNSNASEWETKPVPPKPKFVWTLEHCLSQVQLYWHSIRTNGDPDPYLRTQRSYERKGWLCLAVYNFTQHEGREIRKWCRDRSYYGSNTEMVPEPNPFMGEYKNSTMTVAVPPEGMEPMKAFLQAFPKRETIMEIANAEKARMHPVLRKKNYLIIEGTNRTVIGLPALSDEDQLLLHLTLT